MVPENILRLLNEASHVVLATHIHPDGDALGSLFGFGDILEGLGKKVFRYLDEPVSHIYDFLPRTVLASTDLDAALAFAEQARKEDGKVVFVALDCGDGDRLGASKESLLTLSPSIVIDHHQGHRKFGDHLWLESSCSSTGEMIYELALAMGGQVALNAAFCLYVALLTDTGSFRYESTSPRTLRIAADLVEIGVRPAVVAGNIYDNCSLSRLRLMERVLATLFVTKDERIGMIHATEAMFQESGASSKDTEGFIDFPRSLNRVQVAAFLKETEPGSISVSMRAKGQVNVASIAADFGGGGHKNAAGCRIMGKSIEEAHEALLKALRCAIV